MTKSLYACIVLESISTEVALKSVSLYPPEVLGDEFDDEPDDGHEAGEDTEYPMLYCSTDNFPTLLKEDYPLYE